MAKILQGTFLQVPKFCELAKRATDIYEDIPPLTYSYAMDKNGKTTETKEGIVGILVENVAASFKKDVRKYKKALISSVCEAKENGKSVLVFHNPLLLLSNKGVGNIYVLRALLDLNIALHVPDIDTILKVIRMV